MRTVLFLRDVPQDAGRVVQEQNGRAPRLWFRLRGFDAAELFNKPGRGDMRPPLLRIIDDQLQHAVFSPVFVIKVL